MKIQVQGVHHITLVGSTRQSAIDFWQGALGMPFVLEQPNLGKPDENHLYFDPGDGRLLTVFTNEEELGGGTGPNTPWFVEDVLKERGAIVENGAVWTSHVVRDGNLITGQNPQSSEDVAKEVLKALAE